MFPLMHYDALAIGEINDEPLRLSGIGDLDTSNGRVSGLYDIEEFAPEIDTIVFDAVLITGYPSVCKRSEGITNPFLFGSYSYRREVAFDTGERFAYEAQCDVDASADTLRSVFSLRGEMPKVALESCLPLVETWMPRDDGSIEGEFSIRWRRLDGDILTAHARTLYSPPHGAPPLDGPRRREIRIRNERPSKHRLAVDQVSSLTIP